MLMVTTNDIAGREILMVKGLVQGSTVQSKHLGRDFGANRDYWYAIPDV